ncbi:MAG: ArsA family ATPase [Solirubrobacteraceae bacterium]
MEGLLAHSLLVVTGKGGVGKSTVAAALGLTASRRGLRTIVAEVAARDDVSPVLGASSAPDAHGERVISDRLRHISIDPERAMEEYLRKQLPMGALAAPLSRSRIFTTLTAATPGMSELLTIGKVWELTQQGRRSTRAAAPYDLVVLDAPATGHGLALLEAPGTFASVARVGPVAEQGRAIASFLQDPGRTAVLTVSTAEEMAVNETLQLRSRLREDLGLDVGLVVVNAVVPHRFSGAEERTLRAAPPSPARRAALFVAGWAAHQRAQIARLRQGLQGVELVTLPFVFGSALDRTALEGLSRELEV